MKSNYRFIIDDENAFKLWLWRVLEIVHIVGDDFAVGDLDKSSNKFVIFSFFLDLLKHILYIRSHL